MRPPPTPTPTPTPQQELAALYNEHADFVWRSLLRLGAAPDVAEDLLHEVFLVVRRRQGDFDRERSIRAWLYGISRGVAANHRRGRSRAAERLRNIATPSPPPTPEEGLERRKAAAFVADFLASLDEPRRRVFELIDIEGLSGPEVGALLGIPVMKVHTLRRSARRRFEAALDRRRPGEARSRRESA